MSDWFTADKEGLKQIAERLVHRRGFGIIGAELYQNVMDTTATTCKFDITMLNRNTAEISVEDDGEGFKDLSHAWRMFAPSFKKNDPTKAGRFNVGEKMVLAFCKKASIHTTSGTVTFTSDGRTENKRKKRDHGTLFEATIECDLERCGQLSRFMRRIIVRPGLTLLFNGEAIQHRTPIHTFEASLKTEIGDDLRPSIRKTMVEVYEPLYNESPMLYELGIPVVELPDDKYDISVQQKCPLDSERSNVTPSYLRDIRVLVFNEMHHRLEAEDMHKPWVNVATSDNRCDDKAIADFLTKTYGDKRVAYDPSDVQSNKKATCEGYTVIPSRGLTPGQRDNAKRAGAIQSASSMFATHQPFSDDPNAPPAEVVPESRWTPGMKHFAEYAKWLAAHLIGRQISVTVVEKMGDNCRAAYGDGQLLFSLQKLGYKWFDDIGADQEALLMHEMAHDKEADELSANYHRELCRLAVVFKNLALTGGKQLLKWYADHQMLVEEA